MRLRASIEAERRFHKTPPPRKTLFRGRPGVATLHLGSGSEEKTKRRLGKGDATLMVGEAGGWSGDEEVDLFFDQVDFFDGDFD